MVYDILYKPDDRREMCLFDIDIYLDKNEYKNDDTWRTEIIKVCCPGGIAKFVFDKIHTEEELLEFQKDCEPLHNIRGILHETMHNGFLPMREASNRNYKEHGPALEKIIRGFADKYGLKINID